MAYKLETDLSPAKMRERITEKAVYQLKQFGLEPSRCIIVGGAAMQVHGLKMTPDVDIVISEADMRKLMSPKYDCHNSQSNAYSLKMEPACVGVGLALLGREQGQVIYSDTGYGHTWGDLTLMLAPNDSLYQASYQELLLESNVIDGVSVSPLERILEWKQAVNREKDAADINLLKQHLTVAAR